METAGDLNEKPQNDLYELFKAPGDYLYFSSVSFDTARRGFLGASFRVFVVGIK
jgi:hypothetical protein